MDFSGLKIICVGNRYIEPDGAALWLYDTAIKQTWPTHINWIEGGLGGLNLLPHFDTKENILMLDFMPKQFNGSLFSLAQTLKNNSDSYGQAYDHSNAHYYLLHSLPHLYSILPSIHCMACIPTKPNWQQQLFTRVMQHANCYEKVA